MARIIVSNGTHGQLFEETVWEKVVDLEFVDIQIEVRDDDGNIIFHGTFNDPSTGSDSEA